MTGSILLVDDDPDVREFIARNLEAAGYQTHGAGDGEEGFERAVALLPDLVITGVMMPKLDGYEMTRRLRADPRTRSIPIVILTAKSLVRERAMGLEAGADLYLTKPFDPFELLAHVKDVLAGSHRQDPDPDAH